MQRVLEPLLQWKKSMTKLKSLVLATALLASGTSLAMAQSDVAGAGGNVTTSANAAGSPPAPGPNSGMSTRNYRAMHHKMYMSAKSSHHKNTSKMGTNGGY